MLRIPCSYSQQSPDLRKIYTIGPLSFLVYNISFSLSLLFIHSLYGMFTRSLSRLPSIPKLSGFISHVKRGLIKNSEDKLEKEKKMVFVTPIPKKWYGQPEKNKIKKTGWWVRRTWILMFCSPLLRIINRMSPGILCSEIHRRWCIFIGYTRIANSYLSKEKEKNEGNLRTISENMSSVRVSSSVTLE